MHRHDWGRRYPTLGAGLVTLAAVLTLMGLLATRPPHQHRIAAYRSRAASRLSRRFQVIGFLVPDQPGALASFQAHAGQLTVVSPLWYQVAPDGSVRVSGFDPAVLATARAHGVAVVPLVTNLGDGMLHSFTTRWRAANTLAALAAREGYAGFNLDFELLPASDRSQLSRFVADVNYALKAQGRMLMVSVFPLQGVPFAISAPDDYAALARSARYLVMMAYDHHYSGGPPGPVAPYSWVASNVATALKVIPADHLILGIGLYGYDWVDNGKAGPAATLSDHGARALAAAHGVRPVVVDGDQETFRYSAGGVPHVVFFMGNRSA
ncbi:MAG: glycosyl hydrolase family 18 protein, partial [Firmicutes bacterium]|nr:glycosyl hydrolase family 18 protein [Bacillota bacterium]